jgi:hypothetical protein
VVIIFLCIFSPETPADVSAGDSALEESIDEIVVSLCLGDDFF